MGITNGNEMGMGMKTRLNLEWEWEWERTIGNGREWDKKSFPLISGMCMCECLDNSFSITKLSFD